MHQTKPLIIRIGAFALLLLGLIISIALFTIGLTVAVSYPDGTTEKVILVSSACFAASLLTLLPSIALFEVMLSFVHLEKSALLRHETELKEPVAKNQNG